MDEGEDGPNNSAFEIPLTTLIECLNIFGTAGPSTGNVTSSSDGPRGSGGGGRGGGPGQGQGRGWRKAGDDDASDEEGGDRRRGPIEAYFGGGSEKRTGMRLSYPGSGYPLSMIM